MKLNELLKQYNVKVQSFPVFKKLEETSNKDGETINLCTLPAELLLQQGITEYYAPVIPRGSIFNTAQEIMDADLDVKKYRIVEVSEEEMEGKETIIISRHWAAVDCAHELFPNVTKILLGDVTEEDVKGKNVVGVLPPFLVSKVNSYVAISIKDYNATEGDLSKEEAKERLIVGRPLRLEEISEEAKLEEFLTFALQVMEERREEKFEDLGKKYRQEIANKYLSLFGKELDADGSSYCYFSKFDEYDSNKFNIYYITMWSKDFRVEENPERINIEYFSNNKLYGKYLSIELCEQMLNK